MPRKAGALPRAPRCMRESEGRSAPATCLGQSAASRAEESAADLAHLCLVEMRDRLDEQCARNSAQVVERDRAVDRHAISWAQLYLRRNVSDGARHQGNCHVPEARNCFVAGEDDNRPAPFLCQLEPADLTASYQGSSRIASRALARAQASSVASRLSALAQVLSESRSRVRRASAASASASLRSSTNE
jgi:hypothetical protein